MTQVVSEPAYSDIMRSLMLCSEGDMELYLRNPASFNIPTGAHRKNARDMYVSHPSVKVASMSHIQLEREHGIDTTYGAALWPLLSRHALLSIWEPSLLLM
jgi:hypothetical protein